MGGYQRYKCKDCSYNFIDGDKRIKYGLGDCLKIIKLYLENCGIRTIERLTGIRNRQISLWIEDSAFKIKEELRRKSEEFNDIKDIEILEVDELCAYVKKKQKNRGRSLFVWIAVDRRSSKVIDFEVVDRAKNTYLILARRIKGIYNIKHLCTENYSAYKYYKISEFHHTAKSETALIESKNSLLSNYLARFNRND